MFQCRCSLTVVELDVLDVVAFGIVPGVLDRLFVQLNAQNVFDLHEKKREGELISLKAS